MGAETRLTVRSERVIRGVGAFSADRVVRVSCFPARRNRVWRTDGHKQ
jgi:hypothetical protein